MDYKIEYSLKAKESLTEIYDYISKNLCNSTAARQTISRIIVNINDLALFPKKNKLCEEETLKKINVRFSLCKNFKILYYVDDDKMVIYILNVFYCKRIVRKYMI